MKKLLFLFLFIPAVCLAQQKPQKDSIAILNHKIHLLNDSIVKLNQRPVMTAEQFIKIYKYESLFKFYRICKRNPTQWKFYRGWSTRVFEQ